MRQSIMSRWSTDNKDDQGISKMIYKLAEEIRTKEGKDGIDAVIAKLRYGDFHETLQDLKDGNAGYHCEELLEKTSNLPIRTLYGYKGAFISRLEVLRAETPLLKDSYPYKLHKEISRGQQAMLEAYDALFNAELEAFKEKRINGFMHLGKPLALLRTIGVDAEEMALSPRVLNHHLKRHGIEIDDLHGLARAIQSPILAYNHGDENPNKVLVSDLFVKGGKLSISLELNKEGKVVELNNISSIHQKEAIEEINRLYFIKDKLSEQLLWVEKEKVLDWFGPAGLTSLIQASNPKLDSVTKILNNFENPKILDEKFESYDENLTITAQKDRKQDRITNVAVFGEEKTGMSISCRIDGRKMLSKKLSAEDEEDFKTGRKDKYALAEKYFARELENSRKKNNGMKR